ncbi:MAG: hypothetical protein L0154_26505 [Chloroflexi bacterium]|nr:hypothetical protein [Chloroflexota bacterium]
MIDPRIPRRISQNLSEFTGREWLLQQVIEWVNLRTERVLLLTGKPGVGKSMICAWLAGYGPVSDRFDIAHQLQQFREKVGAAHFCVAGSGTVSPRTMSKQLAEQLVKNIPGYSDALVSRLGDKTEIKVSQHIGKLYGTATGVYIEQLDLGSIDDEKSFNLTIRDPLLELYSKGFDEQIVLLIDSLDEAFTYTGNPTIVHLLAGVHEDFPEKVRFVTTSRNDPRILKLFRNSPSIDLVNDAPQQNEDILRYARKKLYQIVDTDQEQLVERITQAADGVFLYANMVIDNILPNLTAGIDLADFELPEGLSGLYLDFINREIGRNEDDWFQVNEPLLGLVAISSGAGLTRQRLEQVIGQDLVAPLRKCNQYLVGDLPDGPFRLFHQSFQDFLLDDETNMHYRITQTKQLQLHERLLDSYNTNNWYELAHDELYMWDHFAYHMLEAGRQTELIKLFTGSPKWMELKLLVHGTHNPFVFDLGLLIEHYQDPLSNQEFEELAKLWAVRQVISQQVDMYHDIDLDTLVRIGHEGEAVDHALLRSTLQQQFKGILQVVEGKTSIQGKPPMELIEKAFMIVQSIESAPIKIGSLLQLLEYLHQHNLSDLSQRVVDEILATINSNKIVVEPLLQMIAKKFGQTGFPAVGVDILDLGQNKWEQSATILGIANEVAKQDVSQALPFFQKARNVVLQLNSRRSQAERLAQISIALAQNGLIAEAQKIVDLLSEDDFSGERSLYHNALAEIAGSFVEQGNYQSANVIKLSLDSSLKRSIIASKIAIAFAKRGELQLALEQIAVIEDDLLYIDTLQDIVNCITLTTSKEVQEIVDASLEFFQRSTNALHRSQALTIIARISQKPEQMQIILDHLISLNNNQDQLYTWEISKTICGIAKYLKDSDHVQQILDMIEKWDNKASLTDALQCITQVLQNTSQVQQVLGLTAQIEYVGDVERIICSLIEHSEQEIDIDRTLSFVHSIKDNDPNYAKILRFIANNMIHRGWLDQATEILNEVVNSFGAPTTNIANMRDQILNLMCIHFIERDQIHSALELLKVIESDEILCEISVMIAVNTESSNTLESLLSIAKHSYNLKNKTRLALYVAFRAFEIDDEVLLTQIVTDILSQLSLKGLTNYETLVEHIIYHALKENNFNSIVDFLVSLMHTSDQIYTLSLIVKQLVVSSQHGQAISLTTALEDHANRDYLLAEIIDALLKLGQQEEARLILVQDVHITGDNTDINHETLAKVCRQLAAVGLSEEATLVLDEVMALVSVDQFQTYTDFTWTKCEIMVCVLTTLSKLGRHGEATNLLNKFIERIQLGQQSRLIIQFTAQLLQHSNINLVKQIFNTVQHTAEVFGEVTIDSNHFNNIIEKLIDANEIDMSIDFWKAIGDFSYQSYLLDTISDRLLSLGLKKKTEEILDHMLTFVPSIQGNRHIRMEQARAMVLVGIAEKQIQLKNNEKALEVLFLARDYCFLSLIELNDLLHKISVLLAKLDHYDEAVQVANSIPFGSSRGSALGGIAYLKADFGQYCLAFNILDGQSMEQFLLSVVNWTQLRADFESAPFFEDIIGIATWSMPDWTPIYQVLTGLDDKERTSR